LYDRRCRNRTEPGEGPSVLRFAVPLEGATSFVDLVHGDITVENSNLNDLVLLRSDGSAVYLLANVVDDMADGITHILRADDLLAATPIQILIAAALDRLEPAVYGHLPVVVGPDRAKLSTRHGPVSVVDFREDGILSEAMVNYMALLGWSHPEGREIFSLDELVATFSIERVGDTPAMFDPVKLDSVNFEWIQRLSIDDLCGRALPFFEKAGFRGVDRELLRPALPLAVERVRRLSELPPMLGFLFDWPGYDEASWQKVMTTDDAPRLLEASTEVVETVEPFVAASIGAAHTEAAGRLKVKTRDLSGPPRIALTGNKVGPPLWESMELLGRDECLARLERARDRLAGEHGEAG